MTTSPELIAVTEAEAARQLGVSIGGLRKWRKAGRGPKHVRLGRLIRYRPTDLQTWLETHCDGHSTALETEAPCMR